MKKEEEKSEGSKESTKPNPPFPRDQPGEFHRLGPTQNPCTGQVRGITGRVVGTSGAGEEAWAGRQGADPGSGDHSSFRNY